MILISRAARTLALRIGLSLSGLRLDAVTVGRFGYSEPTPLAILVSVLD